jgi:predicted DNA-binding transcriptional regulator AlpA
LEQRVAHHFNAFGSVGGELFILKHTITALPQLPGGVHVNQANNDAAAEQPTTVFLSKAEVLRRIPISPPTLWSWCRAGKFPAPRILSQNKVVWVEAEIAEWMQQRPYRRYKT